MKRIILVAGFLLLGSGVVSGQARAGHSGQEANLKGLTGVRLIVMLGGYPHRLDEAQRPELLKMVEADAIAKLQEAGIPFSRSKFVDEIGKTGNPRLVITVPMDEPNSSMSLTTEVELLQWVRLSRDSSIEADAVTWRRHGGVGGPGQRESRVRRQIAGLVDRFIEDYRLVNPKEILRSGDEKFSLGNNHFGLSSFSLCQR